MRIGSLAAEDALAVAVADQARWAVGVAAAAFALAFTLAFTLAFAFTLSFTLSVAFTLSFAFTGSRRRRPFERAPQQAQHNQTQTKTDTAHRR